MRLGRRPARRDSRIPALARYKRGVALPPPPSAVLPPQRNWTMSLNDQIGDCTIAGVAHCKQVWTGESMTDAEVLATYEQIGGYSPTDPTSDQGCVEVDVLQTWMQTGIAGDKLAGYCAVNIADFDELKDAVHWFGAVYLGINCPESALSNTQLWDVVPGSPNAGGHAIIGVGYDDAKDLAYVVSWGKLVPVTRAFVGKYLEEAYALLSQDMLVNPAGVGPARLDWATLTADMQILREMPAVQP